MKEDEVQKLQQEVQRLLTPKALRIWEKVEWDGDKEEVGNAVAGFMSLDPETKAKDIADWLNFRAEELIV